MAKSTVFVGDYTLAQKMDLEAEILAETDAELVIAQCRTEAEVLEALVDCDAIITQWAPVTRPVMERGGGARQSRATASGWITFTGLRILPSAPSAPLAPAASAASGAGRGG